MLWLAENLYVWQGGRFCGYCGADVWPLMRGFWTCRRGHHFKNYDLAEGDA